MLTLAVPVKLDFYAAQFIGKDFFARRTHDDGGLRPGNNGAMGGELRAKSYLSLRTQEKVL
ncbi:hypothetical protein PLA106_27936 [Pseudomonas amygdali pv. lachrymans str. M302278]|nr:hypothetical protein PLA106_27936 [Pseudomonas amygdali pv. lachrymans str. M302278]